MSNNRGFSLSIGLNAVSKEHYGGWDGRLTACENDAYYFDETLCTSGFSTSILITEQATIAAYCDWHLQTAKIARAGDHVVVTYSMHGGQRIGVTPLEGLDETFCFYDGELLDDYNYRLLSKYRKGVRISMFIDSCHSGGLDRGGVTVASATIKAAPNDLKRPQPQLSWLRESLTPTPTVKASVAILAACKKTEVAYDGSEHGAFTAAVKKSLEMNRNINLTALHKNVLKNITAPQTPQLIFVGNELSYFINERVMNV